MNELTILDCRPKILAFAIAMEAQLRRNDHKGGWSSCTVDELLKRLREEVDELERECWPTCRCREVGCGCFNLLDKNRVASEAADVANFAMMLSDVTGSLRIDCLAIRVDVGGQLFELVCESR